MAATQKVRDRMVNNTMDRTTQHPHPPNSYIACPCLYPAVRLKAAVSTNIDHKQLTTRIADTERKTESEDAAHVRGLCCS